MATGRQSFTHDVFLFDLSDSGTTEGNSGLLLEALRAEGLRTFIIEDEQRPPPPPEGYEDGITPTLAQEIQASKTAIVVVPGDDYHVSSRRWKVLAYVLDHFRRNSQIIFPVYYMYRSAATSKLLAPYEPPDVEYDDLLRVSRNKYRKVTGNSKSEILKALDQLEKLPGWDFDWREKKKDEFNRDIASQLSKCDPLDVAVHPVGLESPLEEVCLLLKLTSSYRESLKVCLHGKQGIGKSTLARAIYNRIAHLFGGSCFLNMREHDIVGLQEKLLSKLFGEVNIKLEDASHGASMIKDRLSRFQKDFLLILDNVDSIDLLNDLLGGQLDHLWLSSGSKVIITTREKVLLTHDRDDMVLPYKVEPLNSKDGLELLRHRVLGHGNDDPRYTEILDSAVKYADGHPLILEMICCYMNGKTVLECEMASKRLDRIQTRSIQATLDALKETSTGVMPQSWGWRLLGFVASVVGLICNAFSPTFINLIQGWNPIKLIVYVVICLTIIAFVSFSSKSNSNSNSNWFSWLLHQMKFFICYAVFLGTLIYSYFYDKGVDGKPGILSVVSSVASALVLLSLNKLVDVGYETGAFTFFLGLFTTQLFTINKKLIVVAIIIGAPLFYFHAFSQPFHSITRRFKRRFATRSE